MIDQAREALTSQSVPPERSTIERGLYWYDNQYLLTKLFGGWKGIRLGGGDFPAGAGLKFGVGLRQGADDGRSRSDYAQPRRSHRPRRVQHTRATRV